MIILLATHRHIGLNHFDIAHGVPMVKIWLFLSPEDAGKGTEQTNEEYLLSEWNRFIRKAYSQDLYHSYLANYNQNIKVMPSIRYMRFLLVAIDTPAAVREVRYRHWSLAGIDRQEPRLVQYDCKDWHFSFMAEGKPAFLSFLLV